MDLNSPLVSEAQHVGFLIFKMGGRVETRIKFRISYSDIMIKYRFPQKVKLLGYGEFNHLTIILTVTYGINPKIENS